MCAVAKADAFFCHSGSDDAKVAEATAVAIGEAFAQAIVEVSAACYASAILNFQQSNVHQYSACYYYPQQLYARADGLILGHALLL